MINTDTLFDRTRRINWFMLLLTVSFCMAGTAMMLSAGAGEWGEYARPQLLRFLVGVVLMVSIMLCPPVWLYRLAYLGFIGILGLLVAVEVMGHIGGGSQRWLKIGGFNIQPSEFMKLAVVMALARFYHNVHQDDVSHIRNVAVAGLIIGLPVLLILKQPNLGTATVISTIGIAILFLAGLSWKYFATGIAAMAAIIPLAWQFVLKPYQKERVVTFLDPEKDPLGAGYNVIQSQIGIGSGGLWGKGYMNGTQGQLNFLPEKHTDFIFTMLAEEWGFVGALFILVCYAIIFIYGTYIVFSSKAVFGRLVAGGVIAFIFTHVGINTAMVMGLLPVVGLPLPFLSYGGSITLTVLIAMGLLLNMGINKDQPLLFKL